MAMSFVRKVTSAAPALSRRFSSLREKQQKISETVKVKWNGLEERARGAVYDTVGRSCAVVFSGGTGWLWLGKPMSERQDKLEEKMDKLSEDYKKDLTELRVQLNKTEERVLKWTKESDLKNEEMAKQVKDLMYLREVWLATAYLDSAKRA